ncbi:WD repeat-containing protein 75, partial [Tanacetum coccineum]
EGMVPPSKVANVAKELHCMGCCEISLGDTIGQVIMWEYSNLYSPYPLDCKFGMYIPSPRKQAFPPTKQSKVKLKKLQERRADLEMEMMTYKDGRAKGAGVAFVVFKDVYISNKAVQDFRSEKKKRVGKLPVMFLDVQGLDFNDFLMNHSKAAVVDNPLPDSRNGYGSLWFYSLFDDSEISEVQVCERNHQPSDDVTRILNWVALSLEGSVMCTVETRLAEEGIRGLLMLVFPQLLSILLVIWLSALLMVVTSRGWISNRGSQWNEKLSQRARWACHAVGSYRKKPMTTDAFSADGSVLAVAAETFITLWDPEKNVLLAVIGSAHEVGPLVMLCCFIDCKSFIYRRVQLSCICVLRFKSTTLSMEFTGHTSLTPKISTALNIACSGKDSLLAVLVVFPDSSKAELDGAAVHNGSGAILLFSAGYPVPIASWVVTKVKVAYLAFPKYSFNQFL